jgi:type IX secretion system PorP/SprF family membrane protein
MKRYLQILGIFLMMLLAVPAMAQQDPQYNMYMFNPLAVNPAYAGSRDALSVALIHRSQWVGFSGAPTTQNLAIHTPFKGKNMGAGFQIMNDNIGPKNTLAISGVYAYKIRLFKGKLGFGLRASLYNYKFDWSKINYKDTREATYNLGRESYLMPSFDFGMYYSDKKNYIGIEAAHLSENKLGITDENINQTNTIEQNAHLTLTAGRAFIINNDFIFKPSILVRGMAGSPVLLDINASVFLKQTLWLGLSYRKRYGMAALIEYYLTNEFRVGYSYDYPFNTLNTGNGGSHEIFIGFDFDIFKSKLISPRYF